MVLDSEQIVELISKLEKSFGISSKLSEELIKKVENNNAFYNFTCKEINVLQPGIKNAFFFKNAILNFKNTSPKFDEELVSKIKISKDKVQLFDIDKNKLEMDKNDLTITIKDIPIELYMSMLC